MISRRRFLTSCGGALLATNFPREAFAAEPSWYSAISPGTWGTLPNSTLTGSGVDEVGVYELVLAWGGACINAFGIYSGTTFIAGTFLMLFGGGHTDSSLNSVYAYGPLEDSSPTWHRVRSTTNPAPENVTFDANGNPVSRHTYNGLNCVGSKFYALGYYRYMDADTPGFGIFDFSVSNPDGAGVQPWSEPSQFTTTPYVQQPLIALYDSTQGSSGGIWTPGCDSGNQIGIYDIATNAWSSEQFKSYPVSQTNTAAALDPVRGLLTMWDAGHLTQYQTNHGLDNDFYSTSTVGTAPTIGTTPGSGLAGNGSILYDPVDDQFIVWANSGQSLWALKAPATNPYNGGNAWTWNTLSVGGITPGPENGTAPASDGFPGEPSSSGACTGTFGRFALYNNTSTGVRGYLLLNRTSQSISFFRPASATPLGPPPSQFFLARSKRSNRRLS